MDILKRCARRTFMLLILPLLFLFPFNARTAYGQTRLIIHYHRDDGEYDKWNIWSWADGRDGAAYPFTGEDAFGMFADITLPDDTDKAGFIVRTDSWEKDVAEDRFIDFGQGSEIWVYTGNPEFLYEAPEGYETEARPIPFLTVTAHYNRYYGAYDNIAAFCDTGGTAHEPVSAAAGGFGLTLTYELSGLTDRDRLDFMFVPSNGAEADNMELSSDTYTVFLRGVETDSLELWFVYGAHGTHRAEPDLTPAVSAALDAPDELSVLRSYPYRVTDGNDVLMDGPNMGFTLTDATDGVEIPVSRVEAVNESGRDAVFGRLGERYATQFNIYLDGDLNLDHMYQLSQKTVLDGEAASGAVTMGEVYASERFAELFTYTGSDLGVTYNKQRTVFRLWAPVASNAELVLSGKPFFQYPSAVAGPDDPVIYPMQKDVNGTWVCTLEGDYREYMYRYAVTNYGVRRELTDPYARAVSANGGWGFVIETPVLLTNWTEDNRIVPEHPTDAVIYELHMRDFSTHASSGVSEEHRGKYMAFTETGSAAFQHIKNLGITHIHLLPVFDFASLDETRTGGFNWGYDPLNYNAPEGSYATDPFDPYSRISEFKQMVKTLHDNGIGVIMDMVYNHTGPTEDSGFNRAVPGYYYRQTADGGFANGSGCGNETASERSMVRKFIVDSVVYWAEEYHIDGFRFDLMGLHDIETMNAIRAALDEIDPRILMYGEGWTGGTSPLPMSRAALKVNMHVLNERIAAFSDDIRDGIKGSVFDAGDPGYVAGYYGRKEQIKFGVTASVPHPQIDYSRLANTKDSWAVSPSQTITYASAHDNLTLWDKLLASTPLLGDGEHLAMNRMAAAIVLTSQGIPFIHAGEEIARSKGGDENSYQSPDRVNQIKWSDINECQGLYDYYAGLIALRAAHPAFRMTSAFDINEHLIFLDTEAQITAYILEGNANGDGAETILVAFNADKNERELALPKTGWAVVVDGERAGTETLYQHGGGALTMAPRSAYVLIYNGEMPGNGESLRVHPDMSLFAEEPETAAAPQPVKKAVGTERNTVLLAVAVSVGGLSLAAGITALLWFFKRVR